MKNKGLSFWKKMSAFWRVRHFLNAFFGLMLFFASCTVPQDYAQLRVAEVVDGDTVRLSNGQLVRYIGIDAPEIQTKKGKQFIYNPQPFGLEAKEFNRRLVETKPLRLEFDVETKDRYGRLLAYCFADNIFVNAKLLQEGYAVLYTRPPNVKYADEFVKMQEEARSNKRGLWGAYEVIDHTQASSHIGSIRTVKGKVISTYKSPKCLFLNFGQDYKSDFTVVIFNGCLSAFRAKQIDPLTFYKNKTIEVTGKIQEYNGPEIIVQSPYEITVVENND